MSWTDLRGDAVECESSHMAQKRCDCGADLRRLLFGRPEEGDVATGLLNDVILAGCMVHGDGADPNYGCPDCDRRYVFFRGQLIPEDYWLAPLSVEGDEVLSVSLAGSSGQTFTVEVTSQDRGYTHFSRFKGE